MEKTKCDVCGQDRYCMDVAGVKVCEDCRGGLTDTVLREYAERLEENSAAMLSK